MLKTEYIKFDTYDEFITFMCSTTKLSIDVSNSKHSDRCNYIQLIYQDIYNRYFMLSEVKPISKTLPSGLSTHYGYNLSSNTYDNHSYTWYKAHGYKFINLDHIIVLYNKANTTESLLKELQELVNKI